MRGLRLVGAASLVIALPWLATPIAQTPLPPLDELLQKTGAYVTSYLDEASNIVAEEDYRQSGSSGGARATRRLRSDIALIIDDQIGWVAFRDVFEVDGSRVRDREDRLAKLFVDSQADAMARARQVVADSARFNLSLPGINVERTINMPVTAMRFVQSHNQPRSEFRVQAVSAQGQQLARIRFTERSRPRLVTTPDHEAATGFVLVQPDTGVIVETELAIATGNLQATFRTRFGPQAPFRSWLPKSMEETYLAGGPQPLQRRIEAHAVYTNFRSFSVSVDTSVPGGSPR